MLKKGYFILIIFVLNSFTIHTQESNEASIEIVTQEKIQGIITLLEYSPDGRLIASGSEKENSIKVWDVSSGKIIGKLEGHTDETTALSFNQDGTNLISSAKDNRVILWSILDWEILDSLQIDAPVNTFVINSEQKNSFYSGSQSGKVHSWNDNNFREPELLYMHSKAILKMD